MHTATRNLSTKWNWQINNIWDLLLSKFGKHIEYTRICCRGSIEISKQLHAWPEDLGISCCSPVADDSKQVVRLPISITWTLVSFRQTLSLWIGMYIDRYWYLATVEIELDKDSDEPMRSLDFTKFGCDRCVTCKIVNASWDWYNWIS